MQTATSDFIVEASLRRVVSLSNLRGDGQLRLGGVQNVVKLLVGWRLSRSSSTTKKLSWSAAEMWALLSWVRSQVHRFMQQARSRKATDWPVSTQAATEVARGTDLRDGGQSGRGSGGDASHATV
jgi:hypothetical protein